jgi:hypothetical protein
MSMMTIAILPVSTASGAGSAAMVLTGTAASHGAVAFAHELQDRGHFGSQTDLSPSLGLTRQSILRVTERV